MDHSVDNQSGQDEPPVRSVRSRGAPEMEKERETKDDGRYIIFYTFGDEEAQENG